MGFLGTAVLGQDLSTLRSSPVT